PPTRKIYRRVLVELYIRMAYPLIDDVRFAAGEQKAQAQARLRELGGRALFPLSEALADPDSDQRRDAAELIGYLANSNGQEPLAALLDDADPNFRILAALSLGRLGEKSAVSALGRALSGPTSGDASVRAAAAWALGELKSPNAVAYLAKKSHQGL